MHDAGGLAGEVHAGDVIESELIQVLHEQFRTQGLTGHDKGRVAGTLDGAYKVDGTVTANLPAGDPVARYLDIARAVERGGTGDCAGLQRRRRGDQLEYRSRFVGVGNGLVPPLGHLGFTQGCIVFVQFLLVVAGFLFHFVQLRLGIGIVNLTGVVGVKVRLGGHAQDLRRS